MATRWHIACRHQSVLLTAPAARAHKRIKGQSRLATIVSMASLSDQLNESLGQLGKEEEEEELDELDNDDDIGEGKEFEEAALDEEEGVAGVGARFDMEFSEDPPGHRAGERCRGGRGAGGRIHTK